MKEKKNSYIASLNIQHYLEGKKKNKMKQKQDNHDWAHFSKLDYKNK